jgi:hypothetical protein
MTGLRLLCEMNAFGATAGATMIYAAAAVTSGAANAWCMPSQARHCVPARPAGRPGSKARMGPSS